MLLAVLKMNFIKILLEMRFSLTGNIGRIEVKNNLDIAYLILTKEDGNMMQTVRCNFHPMYGEDLQKLMMGQKVTVQGRFDGSIIDLSLRDCTLVN